MRRTVVGLDIGTTGIRAAEFRQRRRGAALRRFASVPLPSGVQSGRLSDPAAVTEALRRLWATGKFRSREVVLGLANDNVLVRQMDLEWMPEPDFGKALRYQVADSLPVPVDDVNLDYYLLDELDVEAGPGEAPRKMARVMLVAAGCEMVDAFVAAVQDAGLRPIGVDLLPFALVRAASAVGAEGDGPLEAIVDIGADQVTIVVHRAGRPRSVRILSGVGSLGLTQALQDAYGWDFGDAERTKVTLGLPGAAGAEQLAEFADHPARAVIAQQTEALLSEVQTTLNYFSASAGEQPLSRILLAGNGSRLPGLADLLAARLAVPVSRLAVRDRVLVPRRLKLDVDTSSQLVLPAGLCLGRAVR